MDKRLGDITVGQALDAYINAVLILVFVAGICFMLYWIGRGARKLIRRWRRVA